MAERARVPQPGGCDDACGILQQWALTCVHPEHRHRAAVELQLPEWAEHLTDRAR
jgi:hypothetical protein